MEHPSDIANLLASEAYDADRAMPVIAPGTFEESDALDRIDNARAEELAQLGEDFAARQKRRAAYWRPRMRRS